MRYPTGFGIDPFLLTELLTLTLIFFEYFGTKRYKKTRKFLQFTGFEAF